MNTATFWRLNEDFYFQNEGEKDLMKAIMSCNLSDEQKFAVLAKMSSYDSHRRESAHHIREAILRTLTETDRPMRVQEIVDTWGFDPMTGPTHQRVKAYLYDLIDKGLVERTEVVTDQLIKIASNTIIPVKQIYFSLVKG